MTKCSAQATASSTVSAQSNRACLTGLSWDQRQKQERLLTLCVGQSCFMSAELQRLTHSVSPSALEGKRNEEGEVPPVEPNKQVQMHLSMRNESLYSFN